MQEQAAIYNMTLERRGNRQGKSESSRVACNQRY